jgi:hypothetical protein
MSQQIRNALYVVAGIALALAVVFSIGAAKARPEAADTPMKYTVVATDGTHLIVTDNHANKVFFYAIEQGGKPGDELKFRGTISLDDVGKPSITPSKAK